MLAVVLLTARGTNGSAESFECFIADTSGKAISEATVHVAVLIPAGKLKADSPTKRHTQNLKVLEESTFTTDTDGRYQLVLPDLDVPNLQIRISAEHASYLARKMRSTTIEELKKHPRLTHRRIQLKRAYKVRGRVTQPNGKPVAGADVLVQSKYAGYSWKFRFPGEYTATSSTTTDEDGNFEATADRLCTFRISKQGSPVLLVDRHDASKEQTEEQVVIFKLPSPKRIRGRVVDFEGKPLAYVIVDAKRNFEFSEANMPLSYSVSTVANEHGEYELPPVPADSYKLTVNRRAKDADGARNWNKQNELNNGIGLKASNDVVPIAYISIEKIVDVTEDQTVVNFSPKNNLKVTLRVVDNARDAGDDFQVRIIGQSWKGRPVSVSGDEPFSLYVPRGLRDVYIATGPMRFRRGADKPLSIGESIPLGRVDNDLGDITIERPPFSEFTVRVKLPTELLKQQRNGSAVDFAVFYAQVGYRKHWQARQQITVPSKMISDSLLKGTAMTDQEIVFQVKSRQHRRPKILHEQRFTLKPNAKNDFEADLRDIRVDESSAPSK